MSSVAARIWSQQIVSYCPHTSTSGETWQCIAKGTATSNGSAGGTTVIDTSADSGAGDTYNGRYWVHILSGADQGQWKRIVDDNGTGTLTLENNGFTSQVVTGVEYEIWLCPDPVVVVDSSSGETDMVDAVRDEADVGDAEFWNGYYAVPITGARRGKIAQITAFNPANGTFVLAAGLGGALTAGDVVLLRKFIETDPPAYGLTEEYNPRLQKRVNLAMGDGVVGPRGGTIGFNSQIYPSGSLSADSVAAGPSVLGGLFEACGLEEQIGTTTTIEDAAATTTSVDIATGTWENFAIVGQAVMHNGNLTWITAIADGAAGVDTLTLSPPLPIAPATGDLFHALRMYKKSTDGETLGCVIETEHNGIRTTMTGCKGSVSLESAPVPTLAFNFNVDHWVREQEPAPYNPNTAYTTAAPVMERDLKAYIDTTATDIKGFTASPDAQNVAMNVQGSSGINGRSGYHLTGYNAGATFRELLVDSSELTQDLRFTARTSFVLAVVYGSHGSTFACRIPVARQIQSPHPEEADGLAEGPIVVEAQDAGLANDGTPTAQKVPDFAFFIS